MSSVDDLKAKIQELEIGPHLKALLPKQAGWFSRKLWVALAAIAAVIYLAAGNVPLILSTITTLVIWYLATSVVQGVVDRITDVWIRVVIIRALSADGKFDADDLKTLNEVIEDWKKPEA